MPETTLECPSCGHTFRHQYRDEYTGAYCPECTHGFL